MSRPATLGVAICACDNEDTLPRTLELEPLMVSSGAFDVNAMRLPLPTVNVRAWA